VDQLHHHATVALPALLGVFMAGNLAALGIELDLRKALAPLRDTRFMLIVLAWNCLLCPGFAWLLVWVIPIEQPYAIGLQLIGLAPAAPFLPMAVRKAGGDLAYAAAFLLIGAAGTVLLMPFALPLIAPGLTADAWTIARPLMALLLAPLVTGLAIRTLAPGFAQWLRGGVKFLSNVATLAMLACIVIVYFDGFVGAIGSYAIAAELLFAVGATVGAYGLSKGLQPTQRSVISLGVCTRNLGAAFAPLLTTTPHPHIAVMVALDVPITLAVTLAAAYLFRMQTARSERCLARG
jgi:BASS family bile acid:Na+ symporter